MNAKAHNTPAPAQLPETPATSGSSSPNAGTKIQAHQPKTYFQIPPWDRRHYPAFTKGYEDQGSDGGMRRFKMTLDLRDLATGEMKRHNGMLFLNYSEPFDKLFVGKVDGGTDAPMHAMNVRDEDLPITFRQEFVAESAYNAALTVRQALGQAISEGNECVSAFQFLVANNVLKMAMDGEFCGFEQELSDLLQELKFCDDAEELMELPELAEAIAELEGILVQAKAVSLYPAKEAAGKEGEAA